MKKGIIVLILLLSLGLYGCTASDLPTYKLTVENGAREWQLKSVAIDESEAEAAAAISGLPESQARRSGVQPMLDDESPVLLSTNIFSIVEDGTEESSGMELYLKAGREYTVKAQVVATVEEEYSADGLDLRIEFPLTIRKDGSNEMAVSASIDDGRKATDRQAIATAMYDLNMEYVPGSCSVTVNGRDVILQDDLVADYTEDSAGENVEVSLGSKALISTKMTTSRVQEFVITYKVRTKMSDAEVSEMKSHQASPIQLKIVGAVGEKSDDGTPSGMSAEALGDCLRSDYMIPRQIDEGSDDEELYIIAKVVLPEWAVDYARQQGITISWGSPLSGETSLDWDVSVRLVNCTETYGQAHDSLSITDPTGGRTWSGVVTSATIWRVEEDGAVYQLGQRNLTVPDFDIGVADGDAVSEISAMTLAGNHKVIQELRSGDNEIYVIAWLPRR